MLVNQNRLIVDICTPTRERRSTKIDDLHKDIIVENLNDISDVYDELCMFSDLLDEEVTEWCESENINDKIKYILGCLNDPGDGSPNILYCAADGVEFPEAMPYDCLENLNLNTCTRSDVIDAMSDEVDTEDLDEGIENKINDTYYVTLYVEDSTSGPEEGGWVAYGMRAVKSIKCDNYEEALKVAQEYDDGDYVKYKGDDFTRYIDSDGEEYIVSIEKPEDRGYFHNPAKTWDESEFGYESPKPKFDSNGKVIRENITEDIFTQTNKNFSYDELANFEKELYNKLKENNLFPEDGTFNNGSYTDLELELIIEGDWKHDHLFTKNVVDDFCDEHNWEVVDHVEEEIGDSDSDYYKARHIWDIKVNNIEEEPTNLKEDFKELDIRQFFKGNPRYFDKAESIIKDWLAWEDPEEDEVDLSYILDLIDAADSTKQRMIVARAIGDAADWVFD